MQTEETALQALLTLQWIMKNTLSNLNETLYSFSDDSRMLGLSY